VNAPIRTTPSVSVLVNTLEKIIIFLFTCVALPHRLRPNCKIFLTFQVTPVPDMSIKTPSRDVDDDNDDAPQQRHHNDNDVTNDAIKRRQGQIQ
jgi:hypothetical protein